ncbi:small multi-drug export protein [Candidatus Peregrinibacteria bacterium]|jgi:uncharacterized membrane protein|nr:small multi-drug export protein [Candidatus Peregrinibacteria bacterium]
MPAEIKVLLAGLTPFLDIKLAVPIGKSLGLSSTITLIFGIAGAMVIPVLMLIYLDPFVKFMEQKSKAVHLFCVKILDKTRTEHSKNFQRFGTLFLISLIAIPIPGSGAGTGAIICYLFGVEYWKSITIVFIGTTIAGLLMTAGVESLDSAFHLFKSNIPMP